MQILVTGVSGYVGAALAPALAARGPRACAASPARPSAWRRPACALDELVTGDALTGAGLDEAIDGVEVAYYLIHSMEGAAGGAFPEQERRGAERFAAAAQAAGVRRVVYLGGLVPREGAASRHLASRLAVEEALLAARARVDRAARLDRDRRPLALVPLPRAADRAAAGAGPARLARATARARSTAATCSPTCARAADAPAALVRPLVGHRRPGHRDLRAADRPDRRLDARRPRPSWGSASRSRRSPRRSPPRSPARTRR